ncbi:hypothetical protein [Azospirillum isscasi]|uniref:hypothetical protein n=1 Tax=Azospirillum isscasi TaxID=3053926 RepID=UPI0027D2DCC8|nr:hypothetical protein [Azospirillum isscasi]
MMREVTVRIALVVAAAVMTPAAADTYQPPQVRPLADPFGRDVPPAGGMAPDLRPDPIPAYRDFPSRWKQMQQPLCQPLFDPQTGKTRAWRCWMADGTVQEIR